MLKSIRLQNFFGFQDCTINLEKGANVLVGINGSGKSNFFKAVKLLTEGIAGKGFRKTIFEDFGGLENMVHAKSNSDDLITSLTFEFPYSNIFPDIIVPVQKDDGYGFKDISLTINIVSYSNSTNYFLTFFIGVTDTKNNVFQVLETKGNIISMVQNAFFLNPETYKLGEFKSDDISESFFESKNLPSWINFFPSRLRTIKLFDIFDTSKSSPIRRPYLGRLESELASDGSNLGAIINQIKNLDRINYLKIEEELNSVNSNYKSIEFFQVAGTVELRIAEEGLNRTTTAFNISDGTLKFLCLMAIFYNPNKGSIICIDEPDLGLHPDMINSLYEAIETTARTSQVIISTHSAHLLDYFELENIKVFEKDDNNATIVNQFTERDFTGWYESFYPGQMWRSGNIGGNRW